MHEIILLLRFCLCVMINNNFLSNLIDLTKEILIQDINNITGKKLSERDFIYGSNSFKKY